MAVIVLLFGLIVESGLIVEFLLCFGVRRSVFHVCPPFFNRCHCPCRVCHCQSVFHLFVICYVLVFFSIRLFHSYPPSLLALLSLSFCRFSRSVIIFSTFMHCCHCCCHFLIVANQYPSLPLLPSLFAHSSSHLMHPGGTVPHLKGCRCKSCPFCLLEIC